MSSASAAQLGVVVVDAGHWGPNLARNSNASSGWTIRGICDRDLDRGRASADLHPPARVSDPSQAALEGPDVDAVATPATTHEQRALTALEAGKHVLVEKPLATMIANGQRMVRTAEQRVWF